MADNVSENNNSAFYKKGCICNSAISSFVRSSWRLGFFTFNVNYSRWHWFCHVAARSASKHISHKHADSDRWEDGLSIWPRTGRQEAMKRRARAKGNAEIESLCFPSGSLDSVEDGKCLYFTHQSITSHRLHPCHRSVIKHKSSVIICQVSRVDVRGGPLSVFTGLCDWEGKMQITSHINHLWVNVLFPFHIWMQLNCRKNLIYATFFHFSPWKSTINNSVQLWWRIWAGKSPFAWLQLIPKHKQQSLTHTQILRICRFKSVHVYKVTFSKL